MRETVLYGSREVRFEERPKPKIVEPTDTPSSAGSSLSER
jgi:hypothetical protein